MERNINQIYENKTPFYRKLDAVCNTIHEFKFNQDLLMSK